MLRRIKSFFAKAAHWVYMSGLELGWNIIHTNSRANGECRHWLGIDLVLLFYPLRPEDAFADVRYSAARHAQEMAGATWGVNRSKLCHCFFRLWHIAEICRLDAVGCLLLSGSLWPLLWVIFSLVHEPEHAAKRQSVGLSWFRANNYIYGTNLETGDYKSWSMILNYDCNRLYLRLAKIWWLKKTPPFDPKAGRSGLALPMLEPLTGFSSCH